MENKILTAKDILDKLKESLEDGKSEEDTNWENAIKKWQNL